MRTIPVAKAGLLMDTYTGLSEGVEGENCIAFLTANLPTWIPAVVGGDISIERAHPLYSDMSSNANRHNYIQAA